MLDLATNGTDASRREQAARVRVWNLISAYVHEPAPGHSRRTHMATHRRTKEIAITREGAANLQAHGATVETGAYEPRYE